MKSKYLILLCCFIACTHLFAQKAKDPNKLKINNSSFCGTWILFKITNPAEKTIIELDEKLTGLSFDCETNKFELFDNENSPLHGIWSLSDSIVNFTIRGVHQTSRISKLTEQKLILTYKHEIREYVRKQE